MRTTQKIQDVYSELKLRQKILSLIVLLLGILFVSLFAVTVVVTRKEMAKIEAELRKAKTAFTKVETLHSEQLYFFAQSISEDPALRKILKTTDHATQYDYLMTFKTNVQRDLSLLFILTDSNGKVLVATDRRKSENEDLTSVESVSAVLDEGEPAKDYLARGNHLYQVVIAPVLIADYIEGAVIAGYEINHAVADALKNMIIAEVSYFKENTLIATTLGSAKADLQKGLNKHSGLIEKSFNRKKPSSPVLTLTLRTKDYRTLLSPLVGFGPRVAGGFVIQRSLSDALAPLRITQMSIFLVSILSLVIGFLASRPVARDITEPIETLEQHMSKVGQGDLNQDVSFKRKDEIGTLASSFNEMLKGLRHKESLKKLVSRSASAKIEQTTDGKVDLGGKRAQVSVLFSDIRSFTTISEQMEPDEVMEMLNEYLSLMNEVVLNNGGDIDKYIGDAIMALFHTDGEKSPSEEAVRCALEMRKALAVFNEQRKQRGLPPVNTGIGINTGIVVEGYMGTQDRMEHTVIGDTVNLASRLEGQSKEAKTTGIAISETTYQDVRHLVNANLMGSVQVKGKTVPVNVYELLGLKE